MWTDRVVFAAVVGGECGGHPRNGIICSIYINMSGKLPMGIAAKVPRARYSAAYPTGRERIAKVTPLPWGCPPWCYCINDYCINKLTLQGPSDPF